MDSHRSYRDETADGETSIWGLKDIDAVTIKDKEAVEYTRDCCKGIVKEIRKFLKTCFVSFIKKLIHTFHL